jgi:hypothetical protein
MCWEDERNEHQHPSGWTSRLTDDQKKKAEHTAATVGHKGVFLLNAEFSPPDPKINKAEPTIWIGPYCQREWKDDESVDESEDDESIARQEEKKDDDSVSRQSVNTVSAADLLMTCATGMDELDISEEELERTMDEVDKKEWKPPASCTRSKTKAQKIIETNDKKKPIDWKYKPKLVGGTRSKRDIAYEQIYKGAEKLTETLKQVAMNKKRLARTYGVDDVDEYFHQRAVEWGFEREVDAEGQVDLAENEELYCAVKPKRKKGITKLVKIVYKK